MSEFPTRERTLEQVASMIPSSVTDDCVRVAVDGVDGAGKTWFADELAEVLRCHGRDVLRLSVDDFHHCRASRYRRGRQSPNGFWLDSYDYDRLWAYVLDPLGPGGSREYRPVGHDLESDRYLFPPTTAAPARSVLLLDGIFLHRDELVRAWDASVFLRVPFGVSVARMAGRDGSSPDLGHPDSRRYVEGQRTYLTTCRPEQRASIVVDNTELAAPRILGPR